MAKSRKPSVPTTVPEVPDADLPFADDIPDETGSPEGGAIPLDWEERQLQEPRRAKNAGQGEYQLPIAWEDLGANADRLWPTAEKGFTSSNVLAFAFQEAIDFEHPSRLFLWFRPLGKQTSGAKKVGLKVGSISRYCYDRVDYAVFVAMRAASSKGKFLKENVKRRGYLYHGPF